MIRANTCELDAGEPNWGRIANHLTRRAVRNRTPLPRGEIYSLAGLAVAMTRADYDPRRAGCGIGPWTCRCGWLQLLTLLRHEIMRRARSVRVVPFTDLAGRRAGQDQVDAAGYAVESALACASPPRVAPEWLEKLTPAERRIVRMRAGGWTFNEIALAHRRSCEWVRWRLSRVRSRLAKTAPQPAPRPRAANVSRTQR